MRRSLAILIVTTALLALVSPALAQFANVGSLRFPTSGSPEAQKHFLRGVAILHSFGWKQAIEQFQAAQQIDPDFAMAYWGETLCYNHPLQGLRDSESPREVLERLGDTRAERAAKAPTDREKGFLEAVEILFGEGEGSQRTIGYMEAMGRLYEKYPDDSEVAAFYSLSLQAAVRPLGDTSFRLKVRSRTIAMKIFQDNPNHPGAAHYIIHAFDDPVHAPLALPAAYRFAEIAEAVSHAQHMPSHIFIQHGMWERVTASNDRAFQVGKDLWEAGDSVGDIVHALDWGQYGDLQRGDYSKAKRWIDALQSIAEESDGADRAARTIPLLKARYIIEAREWQTQPVTEDSSAQELLATGISAVRTGNLRLAKKAESRLKKLAEGQNASTFQIMHKEVAALIRATRNRNDEAVKLLEEGIRIAEGMRPPNGAANPVKPVHELYGEVLLEFDRPAEAVKAFEKSLLRMPNRPLAVLGSARAHAKMDDRILAREQYVKLAGIWKGRETFGGLKEAKLYLQTSEKR